MSIHHNNIIPEEDLIELLQKEDQTRKSELIQQLFEEVEKSVDTEWMQVASKIQFDIVKEYLLLQRERDPSKKVTQKSVEEGVRQLRNAARRHPEIAHYVKFNRARNCPINIGDIVPDIVMAQASNMENVMLLHQCIPKPYMVLVAGSLS